ncbi:MAG: arginine--tRNA ligase [Oscillospiraceae bacterium]|nr:arginine--tRNA ligase [Oscillospiraceae bacterium]
MTAKNFVQEAMNEVNSLIRTSMEKAMAAGQLPQAELPNYTVEIPGDTSHGDFATNAAMVSARTFRNAPAKIAAILLENMDFSTSAYVEKAEIAGPGFINFFVKDAWFAATVSGILEAGKDYGRSDYGKGEKVMIEFVSANPTGPMHMGNARGGAIGDCLAAAMDACGYDVTKEFYINDAGNQIEKFGLSLDIRYQQLYKGEDAVELPEDSYHGEDIKERAQQFAEIHGDSYLEKSEEERRKALVDFALPMNVAKLKSDLEKYRIVYDVWFPESTLHNSGAVKAVVDHLGSRGLTYEKDGAIWYKATEFGGEKDEVLIRANGNPTYFAADIAYHKNKFDDRGFSRVINVWGADHHGHVARLKGAMDAIGLDGSKLDIVLMQLVRLMKDGEPYRMSKRTGKAITLSDLTDLVPIDAARFFFNMREPNSTLDFDLDQAVKEDSSNPVYYVQYAHARICSILKNLKAQGIEARTCSIADLEALKTAEERELIRKLALCPQEIINAAKNYDPARMTHYCVELATMFHKFYTNCRVQGEDEVLMQARISLCMAVKTTLCNMLELLKITVPESM